MGANEAQGGTTIDFDIPGTGPQIIAPLSALPTITATVTIDGTSQPGYSGKPLIEILGTSAGFHAVTMWRRESGFALRSRTRLAIWSIVSSVWVGHERH